MATELCAKLQTVAPDAWGEDYVQIALRSGWKCVYCGENIAADRDTAYQWSEKDHLLPKEEYPELKDAVLDQVLACKPCHRLKCDFDPNREVNTYVRGSSVQFKPGERLTLTKIAKAEIDRRRSLKQSTWPQEQRLIQQAVREACDAGLIENPASASLR
jgi:hypothetical protein